MRSSGPRRLGWLLVVVVAGCTPHTPRENVHPTTAVATPDYYKTALERQKEASDAAAAAVEEVVDDDTLVEKLNLGLWNVGNPTMGAGAITINRNQDPEQDRATRVRVILAASARMDLIDPCDVVARYRAKPLCLAFLLVAFKDYRGGWERSVVDEAREALKGSHEEKLTVAALQFLALHGEGRDVGLVRRYLGSQSEWVRETAKWAELVLKDVDTKGRAVTDCW